MERIVYICCSIFVLISLVFVAKPQQPDPTPTVEPLPTLSRNTPFWDVFPTNLYCHEISDPFEGPTWGEVTIGVSTVEDITAYVLQIGNYDSINQWADYISFARTGIIQDESNIPSVIGACIDTTTQIITALSVDMLSTTLYLQDLVARYGIPDAVTWGTSVISRTVFWFSEGISVSVNIYEENRMLDYSQIGFIVYFPYQTNGDFEGRWPYNQTNSENPVGGDRIYDPPPSEEQNPFDFDAMIATITAEPSRTPTPTFIPPPTVTGTATP